MRPRDVHPSEMLVFELLACIADQGFQCCVAVTRDEVNLSRAHPYIYGESEKRWWFRSKGSISHRYLQCLLLAPDVGGTVPHLGHDHDYRKLLEPGWEPKKRQKAIQWTAPHAEDDCEIASPARKKKRAVLALPWDGDDAENEESEQSDIRDATSSSSSSSSSSSTSSSSSGSSSSKGDDDGAWHKT